MTGGAGYIGSHVCVALREFGHEVAILDDFSTGLRERVSPETSVYVGSLLDRDVVAAALRAHKAEAVVHIAAKKAVEQSIADPLLYYRENVLGMHSVLSAMVVADVPRILFSSSAAVYGVVENSPVDELCSTKPTSPYGTTKLMCEQMIHEVATAHGISWSALRYFNVAGAAEVHLADTGENNLIPRVFRAITSGLPPQIYGQDYPTPDGTCVRDYVHVADVANAHAAVLNQVETSNVACIYNIGTGVGASVLDVITAVRQVTGIDFEYEMAERRPGDTAEVVADPTLIYNDLGWKSQYDLTASVVSAWRAWSTK